MLWATYGLPRLSIWGTYEYIDKNILPFIDIDPKYTSYNTLDDIEKNIPDIRSPTACYFKVNKKDNSFYRDQQDCIVWYFKPDVGVYMNGDENQLVSTNLPEFLSRIDIESRIWYASELSSDELHYIEHIKERNEENRAGYLEFDDCDWVVDVKFSSQPEDEDEESFWESP